MEMFFGKPNYNCYMLVMFAKALSSKIRQVLSVKNCRKSPHFLTSRPILSLSKKVAILFEHGLVRVRVRVRETLTLTEDLSLLKTLRHSA